MAADDHRRTACALRRHGHALLVLFHIDALRVQAHLDTFALENILHRRRYILILTRYETRRLLQHRHAAAEAAVHLRKLQADVAAADHHQMLGQSIHIHNARVREVRHVLQRRPVRHEWTAADVNEDFLRRELSTIHAHAVRAREARVPPVKREVRHALDPVGDTVDRGGHDRVLARLNRLHVDANRPADGDTEVGVPTRDERCLRARHQSLGWDATVVDASAAEMLAFDEGYALARLR